MKPLALPALVASLFLACGPAMSASVPEPAPWRAFQGADGSFTVLVGGTVADPYFANKALIIAMDSGLDVRVELKAWLAWLLPRQRKDGGFDRFCTREDSTWVACMAADADDSTAATTIHLIRLARARGWIGMLERVDTSTAERRAAALLASLRDPGNGLYQVFPGQSAYYLMDNIEVYEALKISRQTTAAANLATAIGQRFRHNGQWLPALPALERESFYPHALAPTYLWGSGMLPKAQAAADMAGWLAQYSATWLNRQNDHYAWGIVAWNIHGLAPAEAACWRLSVRSSSGNVGWTVLDAMADAALAHRSIGVACTRQLGASLTPLPGVI